MIRYNWHTHTKRCGHAVGEDEEYVKNAAEAGIKILGFSDHAAYKTPNHTERMNIEQVPDYIQSISRLKKKYADTIEIHLGMEVEYYPSEWETLTWYRKNLEYLILGQHNLTLDTDSSYEIRDRAHLMTYVSCLEEACRHHLAEYICHPDVALWGYPSNDGSVREAAQRIADISLKYSIPLELNCGSGVRDYGWMHYEDGDRYAYPNRVFFEEFARKHCMIIIGMDIHDPKDFLTDTYLSRALDIVKGLDLNYVQDYDILSAAQRHKKEFF